MSFAVRQERGWRERVLDAPRAGGPRRQRNHVHRNGERRQIGIAHPPAHVLWGMISLAEMRILEGQRNSEAA